MESTFRIPTPKTPAHSTSRDDRLRIQTLYFEAAWGIDDIALQLNLTRRQVQYALEHRPTPQKFLRGRHVLLDAPKRKQLIEWVTANAQNRRVSWSDIPTILGWQCSLKAIRTAFKKEGYARRIARRKPPISEANRILRLQWAREHRNWTEEQWDAICWSDESWIQPGPHKKQRVTRKIGLSEIFHPDCVVIKYQRNIGWMFWGAISGKYGRGLGIFWEKSWGKINRFSYSERIVNPLSQYLQAYPELQFQQDGGPGHTAKYTMDQFITHGITPIQWPAFSPDLSPIEKIWDRLKEIIEKKDPTIHQNYKRLRAAVVEAWELITHAEIRDIIRQMPERCQAVIDANGMYTKW